MTDDIEKRIRERVEHARTKHPTDAEWRWRGYKFACDIARDEFCEFEHAINHEGIKRAEDEALDVIAVLVRFLDGDWR